MEHTTKILLVDDEPFVAKAVSQVLGTAGFLVAACTDWTSVARAVRTEEPDLVLLDYNMPGIKGDEMCRILKRNAPVGGIHIVIFSSEPESDLIDIVDRCGADGFIRKNAPGSELVERTRAFATAASRV